MQLFSADATKQKKNFAHEKLKKTPQKVAHNRPKPFYFTVQPRIDFSYHRLLKKIYNSYIFHIMKSRNQTSVLLSVAPANRKYVCYNRKILSN